MAKDKSKPADEKEVKTEEAETVEEAKPVEEVETVEETKLKRVKNNSEKGIKIKLVDDKKNFKWITVKPGDIVEIPKKIAKANGLVRVE